MTEAASSTPRWGNEHRKRKADAIGLCVRHACGEVFQGHRWLDIGCGSGGIAFALAEEVGSMTGVDPEPWPDWKGLEQQAGNLRFICARCDGADLPMPPESADVIVCNQVYEHVGDPAQLIRNIAALLVPGGRCYFAGPNLVWPVEPHVYWPFVHWLPRQWAQRLMSSLGSSRADALDAWSSHCWQLRRWFRSAGFEVRWILRDRIAAECRLRGWRRTASLVGAVPGFFWRLMEPVSPGFVYELRKPDSGAAE